jgi:hypothetical protein
MLPGIASKWPVREKGGCGFETEAPDDPVGAHPSRDPLLIDAAAQ